MGKFDDWFVYINLLLTLRDLLLLALLWHGCPVPSLLQSNFSLAAPSEAMRIFNEWQAKRAK